MLQRVSALFRQGSFVGGVAVVMSGSAAAQLFGVALAPFITRIYGPQAYGTFGVFVAITGILVPIVAWALETAIVIPEDSEAAERVVVAALVAVCASSVLTLVASLLGGPSLVEALGVPELIPFLPLFAAYVFAAGISLVMGYWLLRAQRFGRVSLSKIAQALSTGTTQLGLGLAAFIPGGLLLGSLTGHLAAAVVAATSFTRADLRRLIGVLKARGWRQVYRSYADFPTYKVPQRAVVAATEGMVTIVLAALFTPATAGLYALTRRILSLPIELIGESIRKVLLPKAAALLRSEPAAARARLVQVSVALLGLAAIPLGLLLAFGPWAFGVVFGDDWTLAGHYARIVGVHVAVRFVAMPFLTIVPVMRLNRYQLRVDLIRLALSGLAFVAGWYTGSVEITLIGFAAAGILSVLVMVLTVTRNLTNHNSGPA